MPLGRIELVPIYKLLKTNDDDPKSYVSEVSGSIELASPAVTVTESDAAFPIVTFPVVASVPIVRSFRPSVSALIKSVKFCATCVASAVVPFVSVYVIDGVDVELSP